MARSKTGINETRGGDNLPWYRLRCNELDDWAVGWRGDEVNDYCGRDGGGDQSALTESLPRMYPDYL